ncbi:hypothetical protein PVNG_03810 [Plasmodium vivax North Korean]|uniref:Uncharacterized protein n=1 Tax=Plasmodium vivax North Korean TaxID=1035514 RepID=A0A0J9TUF2_PLAVI|nr:hypothetical protein PVNG_03810 [Plasmodium vivax North Korean]
MSDDILDIKKLEEDYPFLKTVWNTYNEFDNSVDGDRYKPMYETFCIPLMAQLGHSEEKHKNFCLKLVRNLGCYPGDNKFFKPSSSRCQILYYWIYNSIKQHYIPDDIIKECFKDYIRFMGNIRQNANCNYHSYDELYKVPKSLILLDIFESSINTIRSVLINSNESTKIPYQKYVCECVKTYKDVHKNVCLHSDPADIKGNETCSRLSTIKKIYDEYLFNWEGLKAKVPSLDGTTDEYFAKCLSEEKLFPRTVVAHHRPSELSPSRRYDGETSPNTLPSGDVNVENQGSPTTSTVSTAVGTVAGASSILALLYKVNMNFI